MNSRKGLIIGIIIAFVAGGAAGMLIDRSKTCQFAARKIHGAPAASHDKAFSKDGYVDELSEAVGMTPEQKGKAAAILKENESSFMALRDDMREKYAELRERTSGQIREILDEGQRKKYDEFVEKRRDGRKMGDFKKGEFKRGDGDKRDHKRGGEGMRCPDCKDGEMCEKCRKRMETHKQDRQLKDWSKDADSTYGLNNGEVAPDFTVTVNDGSTFHMKDALAEGPLVLVFYRGGWCPYCQVQLRELQTNVEEFHKRGAKLVALSVDKVESAQETMTKENLGFPLLTNPDADVLASYHLTLKLDDATLEKYETYGIDVEKASGKTHHTIAVPAVFVIDESGVIRWSYVNENYKVRASISDILGALDKL